MEIEDRLSQSGSVVGSASGNDCHNVASNIDSDSIDSRPRHTVQFYINDFVLLDALNPSPATGSAQEMLASSLRSNPTGPDWRSAFKSWALTLMHLDPMAGTSHSMPPKRCLGSRATTLHERIDLPKSSCRLFQGPRTKGEGFARSKKWPRCLRSPETPRARSGFNGFGRTFSDAIRSNFSPRIQWRASASPQSVK